MNNSSNLRKTTKCSIFEKILDLCGSGRILELLSHSWFKRSGHVLSCQGLAPAGANTGLQSSRTGYASEGSCMDKVAVFQFSKELELKGHWSNAIQRTHWTVTLFLRVSVNRISSGGFVI